MKDRNNLRYRRYTAFSVYYELDVTPSGTYLAVPRQDLERLGFLSEGRIFLSEDARRSFRGNVVYLTGQDVQPFMDMYRLRRGSDPDVRERTCNNIARLPSVHTPIPPEPAAPYETIAYTTDGTAKATTTDLAAYDPYVQSVTDFLMTVLVDWIVRDHPVQGPKFLDTRLKTLRTWLREKVVRLRGTVYDDKTRLMWAYTRRTDFPVCPTCGRTFGELENVHLSGKYDAYRPHCSSRCAALDSRVAEKLKRTSLARYGSERPGASQHVPEKIARTVEKRYGVKSTLNLATVRDAIRQTCLRKYGSETPLQNKAIYKKTKDTVRKRYGIENVLSLASTRSKARTTIQERYGVTSPLKSPVIREKMQCTVMKHLGVRIPAQSPAIMDRIVATRIRNQALENRPKMDGLTFDSRWELAFYRYCTSHGMSVTYHPCCLTYAFEGANRRYYPDFRVNGKLYEVKGDCFINKDGTWKCPFRKKGMSNEAYGRACRQMEAKRKCIVDHGVIVVSRIALDNLDRLFEDKR